MPASLVSNRAEELLREMLGADARFREGQLEAILATVDERARALLVQRTGWGKSLVYFIATKILREQGLGPTLLISPLLSLMRNQVEAAGRIGIRQDPRTIRQRRGRRRLRKVREPIDHGGAEAMRRLTDLTRGLLEVPESPTSKHSDKRRPGFHCLEASPKAKIVLKIGQFWSPEAAFGILPHSSAATVTPF